jgi:hypothetical protein
MDEKRAQATQYLLEASKRIRDEPQPRGEDIWDHVYADRDRVHEAPPVPHGAPDPGGRNGTSH